MRSIKRYLMNTQKKIPKIIDFFRGEPMFLTVLQMKMFG